MDSDFALVCLTLVFLVLVMILSVYLTLQGLGAF